MLPDDTPVRIFTSDAPHDECGVFGVSTPHAEGVAQTVLFGLFSLQHRGQEAAGIAVSDGSRVRLGLRFPSEDYAEEYGACREYLPQEATVDRAVLDALPAPRASGPLAELARRRIILDLPRRYY